MTQQDPNNCSHTCENCSADCASRTKPQSFLIDPNPRSTIRKKIGIISGKGGVGKSFVTALLASEMQRKGYRTAVLDGDITGPSQGYAFGIHEKAMGDGELIMPARSATGIQVITTNMLLETEETPVIWRGPMVANILKQFYQEVFWDDVDYMFIDMPPGTGDVPLTLFQSIPLDGIIIVTSPQELVSMVVEKAVNMAQMMNIPVIGLIENMAYVECDDCGKKLYVFGESHAHEIAEKFGIPLLAQVPLNPVIAKASDEGNIDTIIVKEIEPAADYIEKKFM
ncbi:MAG: Mrp/NBP35 family ATP-binding protein [Solobacterium sp.]|jgi:Mrp family chromosome partitioning ATPase|nr:Mrp/NBP35 family ATP-binding protein [Solobacterium sp.]